MTTESKMRIAFAAANLVYKGVGGAVIGAIAGPVCIAPIVAGIIIGTPDALSDGATGYSAEAKEKFGFLGLCAAFLGACAVGGVVAARVNPADHEAALWGGIITASIVGAATLGSALGGEAWTELKDAIAEHRMQAHPA